jgi:hypothetical protein
MTYFYIAIFVFSFICSDNASYRTSFVAERERENKEFQEQASRTNKKHPPGVFFLLMDNVVVKAKLVTTNQNIVM